MYYPIMRDTYPYFWSLASLPLFRMNDILFTLFLCNFCHVCIGILHILLKIWQKFAKMENFMYLCGSFNG